MSTSRLDRLASAAADELLDTAATGTDTVARRAELDRVRRNRRGARLTAVAAVMASVLIVLLVQGNFFSDSNPQPMKPLPGIDIGDVPVWYDDAGLHRGNIVEQTPVELRQLNGNDIADGALGPGADRSAVPGSCDRRRVVAPLGRRPAHRGTGLNDWSQRKPERRHRRLVRGIARPVVYDTVAGREIARSCRTKPSSEPTDPTLPTPWCQRPAR